MKNKGFTLIELLAVIVVLALVALITVPVILNVIDNVRKESYRDSVYGIMESGKIYLASHIDSINETEEIEFTCDGSKCTSIKGELSFKGSVPKSGSIYISGNGLIEIESLYNGKYYANGTNEEGIEITTESSITRSELINLVNQLIEDNKNQQAEINDLKAKNVTTINEISNIKANYTSINEIYPVGSIYITLNDVNPSTLFPGTIWERYGQGKTLVGHDGTNYITGATGGSSTVTLTLNQIPSLSVSGTTSSTGSGMTASVSSYADLYRVGGTSSNGAHTHSQTMNYGRNAGNTGFLTLGASYEGTTTETWANLAGDHTHTVGYYDKYADGISVSGLTAHTHTFTGAYTNNNQTSVSVQDPYTVVYMWKRTN